VRVVLGEDALREAEASASGSTLRRLQRLLADVPEGAIPFMQCFNLWRGCTEIAAVARELAPHASALLGTPRVRLYQDSLFIKRVGDGPTPWHSDLAMAPLDTNDFVTAWVPLHAVPADEDGGSGLVFASGSHRDVALHFWHGDPEQDVDASSRGYEEDGGKALAVGDATWHHGWTLHACSGNGLSKPRRAMAFSFFADGATRLRKPRRSVHDEDAESYQAWIKDMKPGALARHKLLPLVWDDGPVKVTNHEPRQKSARCEPQKPRTRGSPQQERGGQRQRGQRRTRR
jgi:hypothetical protein